MSFHMNSVADGITCTTAGSASDNDHDGETKTSVVTTMANSTSKQHASTSRFVTELKPEEIRWFYKRAKEDKTWQPLNGHDSLVIESAYRKHMAQEKGDSTTVVVFGGLYRLAHDPEETPATTPTKRTPSKEDLNKTTTENTEKAESPTKPKKRYRLKPIYWEGSSLLLTRGTWFFEAGGGDWQPLDADSAEFVQKIENKHLNVFSNQRIPEKPVYFEKGPRPVLCEVCDAEEEKYAGTGARARWHSVVDVLLINNSRSSRLWRYLKLTGAGTKLMRGYHTEAKWDDGPPPVNHLCFVIHGIGQKRQRNQIVTNATSIREVAEQLVRSNYPNLGGRPMFLPVDWRNELHLDDDLIASITPNYLETIRGFFNETLMDLLYYASPIFGPEVISGLSKVLNRLYRLYLSNDPGFEERGGRVSLIAHSLGSVITYDILTGGWYGKSAMQEIRDDRISIMPGIDSETTRLIFPVEHLFCFGSPLGVFLAARHRRGLKIIQREETVGDSSTRPHTFRLHNIYHPADPVAYRIEPLVSEIYSFVRPLRIHRYDTHEHSPYDNILPELLKERSAQRDRSASGSRSPVRFENGPMSNERSESEENISGFESDEGPMMAVHKAKERVLASSSSPPPKRSWSAALISRFGMGKTDKENTTPQRAPTPEVASVVDGEKPADGVPETAVLVKAVEQAAEATESTQPLKEQNKTTEVKDGEKPVVEKKDHADAIEIPPNEALPYRIDYTLRQGRMEYAYWAAIVSHISYWANHDAIMYVLSALYGSPKNANGTSK